MDDLTSESSGEIDQSADFTLKTKFVQLWTVLTSRAHTWCFGKQSLVYAYTATVVIMIASSAIPQPMMRAPTVR